MKVIPVVDYPCDITGTGNKKELYCSLPSIKAYGDFNGDKKIDFIYERGADSKSYPDYLKLSKPDDSYEEIYLDRGGC